MAALTCRINANPHGTVGSNKNIGRYRLLRPDFTDPKFSNFQGSSVNSVPWLTIVALRAIARLKAKSKQSLNPSEIRFVMSSEFHYLVPIPLNSSNSVECYFFEPKERVYNPVQVDLTQFKDGERRSFVAGLEVGRMLGLENQFLAGSWIARKRVEINVGGHGMDGVSDDEDGFNAALAYVLSKLSLSNLPLPVSLETPHYIVTVPNDATSGGPIWFVYEGDTQRYKHIQVDLCRFPYNDHTPFVAGVEVGRRSVLDYEFDNRLALAKKMMEEEEEEAYGFSGDEEVDEGDEDEMIGDGSWLSNQFHSDEENEDAQMSDESDALDEHWLLV